jgi:hypothetical protein
VDDEVEPRRSRIVEGATEVAKPRLREAIVAASDVVTMLPDLDILQQEAYERLPPGGADYAEGMDHDLPLWSITHKVATIKGAEPNDEQMPSTWSARAFRIDWGGVRDFYIYSGLRLKDIAFHSGIPLRRMEYMSSRYGWTRAKRVVANIKAHEMLAPRLSDIAEELRKQTVSDITTDLGVQLSQVALSALQSIDPTKVTARDLPGIAKAAMELMTVGQKMPGAYRHSVVDAPKNNGDGNTTNNILAMGDDAAKALLDGLTARMKVLQDAGLVPVAIPAQVKEA